MQGLARDTAILLVERAVRLLAGLLVAVYCARTLGPADYGLYTYALSLVVLFSFLSQAGLEQILVRELVRRTHAPETTLAAAFVLRLLGGLSAALLATVAARITSSAELPATLLVMLLACSGLIQASYVLDAWLQSQQAFRASSTAKTLGLSCAAGARIAAVLSPAPLYGLALVSIGEASLTALLLWWAARHKGLRAVRVHELLQPGELRRLSQLSRPMLWSSLAVAIYTRADVFLLGQLSSRTEAGLYSAATALSEAFYVLPIALMTAAGPRLATLHQHDLPAFRRECVRMIRYASAAGLLVAGLLSLLSSPLTSLVYGGRYAGAPAMLAVHAWSTWMVFVSVASEPWYLNQGLMHLYARKTIVAAVANVLLNLWLIPRHGGVGAAVATVVSYALSAFACNLLWRETRGLFLLQLRAMLPLPSAAARSGHA
jgi:PST family polysaccharide transporter